MFLETTYITLKRSPCDAHDGTFPIVYDDDLTTPRKLVNASGQDPRVPIQVGLGAVMRGNSNSVSLLWTNGMTYSEEAFRLNPPTPVSLTMCRR